MQTDKQTGGERDRLISIVFEHCGGWGSEAEKFLPTFVNDLETKTGKSALKNLTIPYSVTLQ